MSISIHELLAVARESEGVKAVKGDAMLCEKRFAPSTEYSCGSKSQIQKFGNQSSSTRKSPFLCLITCLFLWGY